MTSGKPNEKRDHGGGIDRAAEKYGGQRDTWIDLSTGINAVPYPTGTISDNAWSTLPDQNAVTQTLDAARAFWGVPPQLSIVAAPGLSSVIVRLPHLINGSNIAIPGPTYNEYAASFRAAGWSISDRDSDIHIHVHPNNPDGRIWKNLDFKTPLTVIDESFCDVVPDQSWVNHVPGDNALILKSFGKFWGLAGLRLGFAIGSPKLIEKIASELGPWPVSGPALSIGARALRDLDWADQTRHRLQTDAQRLDTVVKEKGARVLGGTTLFRLYHVDDAKAWQDRLAKARIWSRIFPYDDNWLRLGIPAPADWTRLQAAL